MGSMLGPIDKNVKSQMHDISSMSRGEMPWPQTGTTQYHALLGLPDKGRAIKGLVVCNNCDLDLLNGLALVCLVYI